METNYVKIILASCLAVILLLGAFSIHSSKETDSSETVNNNQEIVDKTALVFKPFHRHGTDWVAQYYRMSGLAAFAANHRGELRDLRQARSMMCGTISSISHLDCEACSLFITTAKHLIESGATQDDVISFAKKTCIDLEIEDQRVCDAIVMEFKVLVAIFYMVHFWFFF